jgi:hypothetical protein
VESAGSDVVRYFSLDAVFLLGAPVPSKCYASQSERATGYSLLLDGAMETKG